jgi:NAD(P)-dependent dehydrogenase (short-subunit alcohol dehydrogenase family)
VDLGIAGRVAIVTGGSQGIGLATAELLGREGASVLLAARTSETLQAAVAALSASGVDADGAVSDVTQSGFADVLRDHALNRWGRIDIVVNNAGGGPHHADHVTDFDEDVWVDVFKLNVTSAMHLTRACVPDMVSRRWGRVVNVASTAARDPDPRFASYGAAKAALVHVTRTCALAYAADGVLVHAVLPGLTRSAGVLDGYQQAAAASGRSPDEIERRMIERQPIALNRTGDPAEVAAAIGFLCSAQASWMTGTSLLVDGGTVKALP